MDRVTVVSHRPVQGDTPTGHAALLVSLLKSNNPAIPAATRLFCIIRTSGEGVCPVRMSNLSDPRNQRVSPHR